MTDELGAAARTEAGRDGPPTSAVGPETITTFEAGWWESERAQLLAEVAAAPAQRSIDLGCGRGALTAGRIGRDGLVVGCDAHRYAEWSRHPGVAWVVADLGRLPFRAASFQRASAFDVIEHVPDDGAVLGELARVTDSAADVVITVPADPNLWSAHDERVGHFRRYRRVGLLEAARRAGLRPVRSTHFFAWLYPIAFALRRSRGELSGDEGGGWTSRLAGVLCRIERWWLRRFALPFGTSLLLVATSSTERREAVDE